MSVKAIFDSALELPPAERRAYLDEVCANDPGARAQVERLLRAHDEAGSFLQKLVVGLNRTVDAAQGQDAGERDGVRALREAAGSHIGPYKLLQVLGEGGMCAVFMAEQTQPVQRKVALKVIKRGMDSWQIIARFEAERQALALMDHVNIVRVLDAGATDSGLPYFVMELVHGVPITAYCDDNHLTPRERLELFIPVCSAIQHAHQKGIIHREVKPSNVLVTLYEGKPVPKVVDFGSAKATEQRLTEKTLFTQHGTMVGTLEYMSPEQAEMSALGVDTRSDIYSLGVLLYELLTGSTPLNHQRGKEATYAATLRMIKEEEPQKPSKRLSASETALETISAQRHMEPEKLRKLVRGELDWVVMKTLEKDRNRRYETAKDLAADVQRYLADEPVQACPPTAGYRLGKFLRRNRAPALAGCVVMLALFGGAVGAAYSLIEARKQREVASHLEAVEVAWGEAEAARDGEATARRDAQDTRDRLAGFEYGRTMQVAHQEWRENNVSATLALLNRTRIDNRGWEWRFVHRLCRPEILTLTGHTEDVSSASFSPDGLRVVTGSYDKSVRVWDAKTGAEALVLTGHTEIVLSASFSADGSRIVTAGSDRTARVWDATSGAEVLTLRGHTRRVSSASFSPDGLRVLTDGSDKVRVWDAKTGAEVLTLTGHTRGVSCAAFSPDGLRILSAGVDKTVRVWDARTGAPILTLMGHAGPVKSASFSPDGSRIVTASMDKTARVWDAKTGAEVLILTGHTRGVSSAKFSPDGSRILTGSFDRTVRVWDARMGYEAGILKGHTNGVHSASFSADGSRIVTASADKTARVWDAKTGGEALILTDQSLPIWSASFSPDGSRIVAGCRSGPQVWDTNTAAPVLRLTGHSRLVASASFSPEGSRIVTGGFDKTARVWDAKTGTLLLALTGHTEAVTSASFCPDGLRVVTGSSDGTARVWDAVRGAEVLTLKGHTEGVKSASFSPDGSRVLTAGDSTARVWDARTGTELRIFATHAGVLSASWRRDGFRIVTTSSNRTATVWDVATGREILILMGHTEAVNAASFCPDGLRVVTGSSDGTARVWDAVRGAEVLTLKGHTEGVKSASFSPDGSRVLTAGDSTARVWDGRPIP